MSSSASLAAPGVEIAGVTHPPPAGFAQKGTAEGGCATRPSRHEGSTRCPDTRSRRACSLRTALALLAGCCAAGCHTPVTELKQSAAQRWNDVQARVKARLAEDRLAAGHVADAGTAIDEALRLNPDDPELRLLAARVRLAQDQAPQAERLLDGVPADGPAGSQREYLRGVIAQQRQRPDEALGYFLRALAGDPNEIAHLLAAVQTLQQLGRPEEAIQLLTDHQDRFGWTNAYFAALAECYEQCGQWESAVQCWRKVTGAAAGDRGLRERLAWALHRAGRLGEATDVLLELEREVGDDLSDTLRVVLADGLLEAGRLEEARSQAARVLERDGRNAPALIVLARVLSRGGDHAAALRAVQRALAVQSDDVPALELAAGLALRTGQTALARSLAERLLRIPAQTTGAEQPGNPVAERVLAAVGRTADEQERR